MVTVAQLTTVHASDRHHQLAVRETILQPIENRHQTCQRISREDPEIRRSQHPILMHT